MNHPFEITFSNEGILRSLSVPWMATEGEEAVELEEMFSFAFIDGGMHVPTAALGENVPDGVRDVAQHSPFVRSHIENSPRARALPSLRRPSDATIALDIGLIAITRTIKAHPIHPIPAVEIEIANHDNVAHEVSVYWSLGATNRYMPLSEKGDMHAELLPLLGHRASMTLLRIPRVLRAEKRAPAWGYIQVNAGSLQPHGRISFQVQLWCVRHPWIGTQFSGIAYLLRNDDAGAAIASTAATIVRPGDTICNLLGRHFSPLLLVDRDQCRLPETLRRVIERMPLRLLLTNIDLDAGDIDFLDACGVKTADFRMRSHDPFLAIQTELDERLQVRGVPSVLNVLPRDPVRQLYLSYYYALRQDHAAVGRFTTPLRNLFVDVDSLRRGISLPEHVVSVRLLGDEDEIPDADIPPSLHNVKVRRVAGSEDLFTELSTFFAYHDYTRSRMALATICDRENRTLYEFMEALAQESGSPGVWSASLDQIVAHGKPAAFGPPLSVVASYDSSCPEGLITAAVGAQYAKGIRAVLHLMREPDVADKQWLKTNSQELAQRIAALWVNAPLSDDLKQTIAEIGERVASGLSESQRFTLNLGSYSTSARYMFGQLGLYWFLNDPTLPVEYLQVRDPFGRMLSLGCRTLNGRMSLHSAATTSMYTALCVVRSNEAAPPARVVLAADPTENLKGAAREAEIASAILSATGVAHRRLGAGSPLPCNGPTFLSAIRDATVVHYSGHGAVVDGQPYLVLRDQHLRIDSIRDLRAEPIILLNACELGRIAGDAATQSVLSLIVAGARLVIAPLLEVLDTVASGYAHIYGEFAVMPFAAGVHFVRDAVFLRSGDRIADHLVYITYGDPFVPRGDDLWEAFEASQLGALDLVETYKRTRESVHLRERAVYLYRIAATELPFHPRLRERPIVESFRATWETLAHSADAWRMRELADTMASGPERTRMLSSAAGAYDAAAALSERTFNGILNEGYARHVEGQAAAEEAALAFLGGEIDDEGLSLRCAGARALPEHAVRIFESIKADGDIRDCVAILRHLSGTADAHALLHEAEPLQ